MAHVSTYLPLSRLWTFTTTSYSSSAYSHSPLSGCAVPDMEATTDAFFLQKSDDPPSTLDADATWVAVVDDEGTQVEFTVSASAATAVQLDPGLKLGQQGLYRTRVRAVASNDAGVNQSNQVAVPKYAVL